MFTSGFMCGSLSNHPRLILIESVNWVINLLLYITIMCVCHSWVCAVLYSCHEYVSVEAFVCVCVCVSIHISLSLSLCAWLIALSVWPQLKRDPSLTLPLSLSLFPLPLSLSLWVVLSLLSSTLRGALAACPVCVEANRHNILQSRACCWKARWILHWPAVLSCFPLAFFFPHLD